MLNWNRNLPVIRWLLESSDEAIEAVGFIQVIMTETDEVTERKAIHDLVDVLHPVWWRNPFRAADVHSFAELPADVSHADVLALLPQSPDGSRLKDVIAFLVAHADEAVQIILTILALFGRKTLSV